MYLLPPVAPARRSRSRRPSTWFAVAGAAIALLIAALAGLPGAAPQGGGASPGPGSPSPPVVVAAPTLAPARSPRPSPTASPRTQTQLQPRYALGNGVLVEQRPQAPWTSVKAPLGGRGRTLEFVIRGCPAYCGGATVVHVTPGTFEEGFPVGWHPCPGETNPFACYIYEAEGGRGAMKFQPAASRDDLITLVLEQNTGRVSGERQVEGIAWTMIVTHYGMAGIAVDGDRFVVAVANRGSLDALDLEKRFHGFMESVRFVDPSLTWHGVEIRAPDGWVVNGAGDEAMALSQEAVASDRNSFFRIRAVRPDESVWITSYPTRRGLEPFTMLPAKGFYAQGATFRAFREAVEAGLGEKGERGVRVEIDGRPAWTWHIADASVFGPAYDIALVSAPGVFLVVTAQTGSLSTGALDDFLPTLRFVPLGA